MSDRRVFYEQPEISRLHTRVVERGFEDGKPWVRLDETLFYPEGGGQPSDRGTIGGVPVVDVRMREGRILHFLAGPVEPGPVDTVLDAARRLDFRQQHTAQHLLTAMLGDRHGLPTTSFHLGDTYTAIEVAGPSPPLAQLAEFEDEVNAEIRRALPVTARWVEPDELECLSVRTRGLPDGHEGPVRIVEIEGIDRNTCGGTHVAHLGQIQMLRLVDAEAARGGARIRFLAGGRVLEAMRRDASVTDALKARIGTAPEEFSAVIDGWHAERRRLERRVREIERELAFMKADAWIAESGSRIARFVPGADPDYLRVLASAIVARRKDAVAILAGGQDEACYLVQAGPDGPEDVAPIGERLRERLCAKGGGRGRFHQGRGGRLPAAADPLEGI